MKILENLRTGLPDRRGGLDWSLASSLLDHPAYRARGSTGEPRCGLD